MTDPWFAELYEQVKNGGAILAPVFALLWYREIRRNDLNEKGREALLERVILALEGTKNAIESLEKLFGRK